MSIPSCLSHWSVRHAASRLNAFFLIAVVAASALFARTASATCAVVPGAKASASTPSSVLAHPEVQLIFWGNDWSTNDPSPATLISQIRDVMNGPVMTELNQYGVMTATLAPMVDIIGGTFSKDSSGKGFVTADAITSFISGEIAARRVPAPDSRRSE